MPQEDSKTFTTVRIDKDLLARVVNLREKIEGSANMRRMTKEQLLFYVLLLGCEAIENRDK